MSVAPRRADSLVMPTAVRGLPNGDLAARRTKSDWCRTIVREGLTHSSLDLRLLRLRRNNRVFRGLGHSELHNLLRGYLDCLASRRVSPHPRLAVNTNESADARQNEDAILLDL